MIEQNEHQCLSDDLSGNYYAANTGHNGLYQHVEKYMYYIYGITPKALVKILSGEELNPVEEEK